MSPNPVFIIGERGLGLNDVELFLKGGIVGIDVDDPLRQRTRHARQTVDAVIAKGEAVYGINTGFGKLARVRIVDSDLASLQRNLILSHAVGTGPDLPSDEARLALLLRINALSRGFSGIRIELLDHLIGLFNSGIVPCIPEQGSVGASGDLAPLAHLALLLLGLGDGVVEGEKLTAEKALKKLGLSTFELAPKEGLALINGTQITTSIGALAVSRGRDLCRLADLAAAMSLEASKGSIRPFDARVQEIRNIQESKKVAENVRALLEKSEILASHANCSKVQDQYSLRCVPQVHGSAREAMAFAGTIIERELNAVTDNPLVFTDDESIISAGNFHAQPVSMASDVICIALADLSSISERRTESLVNPDLSGLPAFLAPEPGLHSGFMMAQVTAAALVSENKTLSHPASVDSIPTSANKEDHVSMGPIAARKARSVVANLEGVLAIEFLCACQALDFEEQLKPGQGVEAARQTIRKHISYLDKDRLLGKDIEAMRVLMRSGELFAAVEAVGVSLK